MPFGAKQEDDRNHTSLICEVERRKDLKLLQSDNGLVAYSRHVLCQVPIYVLGGAGPGGPTARGLTVVIRRERQKNK